MFLKHVRFERIREDRVVRKRFRAAVRQLLSRASWVATRAPCQVIADDKPGRNAPRWKRVREDKPWTVVLQLPWRVAAAGAHDVPRSVDPSSEEDAFIQKYLKLADAVLKPSTKIVRRKTA